MIQKKKNDIERPLTEVERELMMVIWNLGEVTVKEVKEELSRNRDLAYTSVATIMKILEKKGFLQGHKSERIHTFKPIISKIAYEAASLKFLANDLFQGNPSSMVMRLLSDTQLPKEELEEIRKLLDERIDS